MFLKKGVTMKTFLISNKAAISDIQEKSMDFGAKNRLEFES